MMDAQGAGPVVTISLPILNPSDNRSTIPAVAGIDMPLKEILKFLPDNDRTYAFIVDNNGVVFYHPKLKLPVSFIPVLHNRCFTVPFVLFFNKDLLIDPLGAYFWHQSPELQRTYDSLVTESHSTCLN